MIWIAIRMLVIRIGVAHKALLYLITDMRFYSYKVIIVREVSKVFKVDITYPYLSLYSKRIGFDYTN